MGCPTSIYGFSGCPCVRTCERVRKRVEAKFTMTIKVKIVSLDEQTIKGHFQMKGAQVGPGRTQMSQ